MGLTWLSDVQLADVRWVETGPHDGSGGVTRASPAHLSAQVSFR
jgi:hypothetical protein